MNRRAVLAVSALAATFATFAASRAADTAPVRIRGTITSLDGAHALVTPRDGEPVSVTIAPALRVTGLVRAKLADIGPNSFVGSAALPGPNGTLRAIEVHIFPEAMRGSGEGFYPFDLQPESAMLNGTVGSVTGTSGRTLTVTYKGQEKTLVVPEGAPIVAFVPGDRALIAPGAHVILNGTKAADGSITIERSIVGEDGLVPPM